MKNKSKFCGCLLVISIFLIISLTFIDSKNEIKNQFITIDSLGLLPAFQIAKFETTIEEWGRCVEENKCNERSDSDTSELTPMTTDSPKDVRDFLAWKNENTAHKFRLPTAQEYDFLLSKDGLFWNGKRDCGKDVWGASICKREGLENVGTGKPNFFGLFNLHGNAPEWVGAKASDSEQPQQYLNLSYASTRHSGSETIDVTSGAEQPKIGFRIVKEL